MRHTGLHTSVFLTLLLIILTITSQAQSHKKYQGLLWEISGNGLEEPSYLYGTMHVSNKVAFHLGEPFFDALESVDRIALELEPEEWFDEVLGGDMMSSTFRNLERANRDMTEWNNWNEFAHRFSYPENTNLEIQRICRNSPMMIDQMLFRFYDLGGNFQEETWLDMYIYQSAVKLGKSTIGLETYKESMAMMEKAETEMKNSPNSYSDFDFQSYMEAQMNIEDAYRKGDLDMLDSLSDQLNPKAFKKYILIERNKKFIDGMDSLMQKAPLFTGMGAAHLPGNEGCIEMLRELGYDVNPIKMGLRDAKRKNKLSESFIKRPLKKFVSRDEAVSFDAPSPVYEISLSPKSTSYFSMDIANGLIWIVDRFVSKNILTRHPLEHQLLSLDSMLFEVIPGDILDKKKVEKEGLIGYDIVHEVSRGDINRSVILFSEHEVIVARLSGTGSKIKKGAGSYFFSSLEFRTGTDKQAAWREFTIPDSSISIDLPGLVTDYSRISPYVLNSDLLIQAMDQDGDQYFIHRLQHFQTDFIEEEKYLLDQVENAYSDYHYPIELNRKYGSINGHQALTVNYGPDPDRRVTAQYMVVGNSMVVLHCHSNRDAKIERFFDSLSIKQESYDTYYPYEDSLLFFKALVPWEESASDIPSPFDLNLNEQERTKSIYSYYNTTELSMPASTSPLIVSYYRYPRYQTYPDKNEFRKSLKEEVSGNGDLIIENEDFIWSENGFVADYSLSDSLSNYRFAVHHEMMNNGLLTIRHGYDNRIGPSEFYLKFITELVQFEDSSSHQYFFEDASPLFLADILSEDSSTFEMANSHINVSNTFPIESRWKVFQTLIDTSSSIANDADRLAYLSHYNRLRFADTSATMIDQLEIEYLNSSDSALYQREILGTLIRMGRPEATSLARDLLVAEAPIGISITIYDDLFSAMRDSLELCATLFPEILDLVDYEEYKDPILLTLVELVDSGSIDSEIYQDRFGYLLRQAHLELRRTRSNGFNFQESIADRSFHSEMDVFDYFTLLNTFNEFREVDALFKQAKNSSQKEIRKAFAHFEAANGEKLSDSLVLSLLEGKPLEDLRFLQSIDREELNNDSIDLVKIYIEDLVEKQWGSHQYNSSASSIDSVQFISESIDSIRTHEFRTFYIRNQRKVEGRNTIELQVVMVEKNSEGPEFRTLHITDDKSSITSEIEQLDEMKRMLISNNRIWPFRPRDMDHSLNFERY